MKQGGPGQSQWPGQLLLLQTLCPAPPAPTPSAEGRLELQALPQGGGCLLFRQPVSHGLMTGSSRASCGACAWKATAKAGSELPIQHGPLPPASGPAQTEAAGISHPFLMAKTSPQNKKPTRIMSRTAGNEKPALKGLTYRLPCPRTQCKSSLLLYICLFQR